MSRLQTRIAVLIVLVLVVLAGGAATEFGDADTALAVDSAEERKPGDADVAFEVQAVLNNSRATSVTETVELVLTGDEMPALTVDEQTVTVAAESTTTVTLAARTDTVDSGTYSYTITVGDRRASRANGTVSLAPPQFSIDQAWAAPVVRGRQAEIRSAVHNRGDYSGMRTVRLLVDRDRDGEFSADETVATRAPLLPADSRTTVTFRLRTDGLEPGTYAYRVQGTETVADGQLTVERPATFRIADVAMTSNRSQGEQFDAAVMLVNVGDATGAQTVRVDGPGPIDQNRTVTLTASEVRTVEFTADTSNLTRGNYSVAFAVADQPQNARNATLRIRESHFDVTSVSGPEQADLGDDLEFSAHVRNTGDASDNQTVEYRIDLDGDDMPETTAGNRTLSLSRGEEATVTFTVGDGVDDSDLLGTHIYGVYSEDANATDVVVISADAGGSGSSTSSATDGGSEQVSLNVISQEKYGYYYEELSGETQRQIEELYERQPFADGLDVTEVLTREEIARRHLGLDVESGDDFNFTALDVEDQQHIEATFDAQFQSDSGDRVESWDELAQRLYGTDYESLEESRQQQIRDRYWEQFEESD